MSLLFFQWLIVSSHIIDDPKPSTVVDLRHSILELLCALRIGKYFVANLLTELSYKFKLHGQ